MGKAYSCWMLNCWPITWPIRKKSAFCWSLLRKSISMYSPQNVKKKLIIMMTFPQKIIEWVSHAPHRFLSTIIGSDLLVSITVKDFSVAVEQRVNILTAVRSTCIFLVRNRGLYFNTFPRRVLCRIQGSVHAFRQGWRRDDYNGRAWSRNEVTGKETHRLVTFPSR